MESLLNSNDQKLKDFYLALEDKFRGTRVDVKKKLSIYLPVAKIVKKSFNNAQIIDIGCGRCEWLELLIENKIQATGVDISVYPDFKEKYNIVKSDALKYIESIPSNSIALITAFHFIEHIGPEEQINFTLEAQRVLIAGGILILETPNSENLIVATKTFYLDPTHNKPVVPEYLDFLAEFSGFEVRRCIPLGRKKLNHPSLWDIFSQPSTDYALVCQKKGGSEEFHEQFMRVKFAPKGMSMMDLTDQHVKGNEARIRKHLSRINSNLKVLNERSNYYQVQIDYIRRILKPIISLSSLIHKIRDKISK